MSQNSSFRVAQFGFPSRHSDFWLRCHIFYCAAMNNLQTVVTAFHFTASLIPCKPHHKVGMVSVLEVRYLRPEKFRNLTKAKARTLSTEKVQHYVVALGAFRAVRGVLGKRGPKFQYPGREHPSSVSWRQQQSRQ